MEEAVAAWKAEQPNGVQPREIGYLVKECLALPEELRRTYAAIFECAKAHELDDYHETGKAFQAQCNETLHLMNSVREWAHKLEGSGQKIAGAAELDAVTEELERKSQEVFERWPWLPTAEEVAEAHAAIARGEYQTVEEILNELRSKNP